MKSNNTNLTILLYHGVYNNKPRGITNYSGKHIKIDKFKKQMMIVKKNYSVLSMEDVVTIKRNKKKWPERSVVISFDDGFKNNHKYAYKVLDQLQIPAIFYVCAGMIGGNEMFWVDKIEDCINRSKKKNISLKLDKNYIFQINSNFQKIKTINTIKSYCKKIEIEEKDKIIDNLIYESKISPNSNIDENYKLMNWQELKEINNNKLFTIGGHSLYHDIMTSQPLNKTEEDIKLTLNLLKYNLNSTIKHYSYPEGQKNHYNLNIINLLKKNGVICSPSAIKGTNNTNIDLFNLRRIMPNFMKTKFPL
ncbi:polysaccharide deacetylase family protein [Alphaproteobacteria bacterium]|jgi:peptidoglycan/xylan/chitin deacetylase (PgdA/CDA1 family)|nr:polysaccharide deacetylase family protein [Alphaproteobacteria bacterium]